MLLLICLALCGGAGRVRAQQTPASTRALKLYEQGIALMNGGRLREAIEIFKASHALHPHLNTVYYMAEAHRRLGQFRDAYRHYERYAALLPTPERAVYEEKLKWLRFHHPCKVSVATQPGGAEVRLDGKIVAQTPADGSAISITVTGGNKLLVLDLEGFEPHRREFIAEFGEPTTIRVTLSPLKANLGLTVPIPGPPPSPLEEPGKAATPQADASGIFLLALVRAAWSDLGADDLEQEAALVTGIRVGYLLVLGRLGLEFSAGFLMSPIKEHAPSTWTNTSFLFTYGVGVGLSASIWDSVRAGATFLLGASTLTGASNHSVFFGDEEFSSVSGNFTAVSFGPELTLSWRPWRGLLVQITPLALDYSPPHGSFSDQVKHLLRIQVGASLGWGF